MSDEKPQAASEGIVGQSASTGGLGAWCPMETCPPFEFDQANWFKDGPRYLLWVGHCTIGSYGYTEKGKGRWRNHFGNIHPTHWMPLPEAPNAEVTGATPALSAARPC